MTILDYNVVDKCEAILHHNRNNYMYLRQVMPMKSFYSHQFRLVASDVSNLFNFHLYFCRIILNFTLGRNIIININIITTAVAIKSVSCSISYCFLVPIATILGSPEIYLDVGSTINLTCIIKHTPMPPADVQWRHNNKVCL